MRTIVEAHEARVWGENRSEIEYRLLTLLVADVGRALTHRQILREVWGPGHIADTHDLRVYVTGLRRQLAVNPSLPGRIRTESRVGYRLVFDDCPPGHNRALSDPSSAAISACRAWG